MRKHFLTYIIALFFISCSQPKDFLKETLGLNIELKEETFRVFEKNTTGEVNFDIHTYEIVNNEETTYKENYPNRPSIPKGWKTKKWKSVDSFEENKLFNIVSEYNYSNDETKKEVLKMIKVINTKGNIYSYSYKIKDKTVEGLQLFVLDIKNSKFYDYEFLN